MTHVSTWVAACLVAWATVGATPADADDAAVTDGVPRLTVRAIQLHGNRSTRAKLIERVLPFAPGDSLRADDPRLRSARYRVLGLGFFRAVTVRLERGEVRGEVVVHIDVVERGTITLNRLYYGSSNSSLAWAGVDVDDRNLFGTGMTLGGSAVFAAAGDVVNARHQFEGELRLVVPEMPAARWGGYGSVYAVRGSEPYRVSGDLSESDPLHFAAFDIDRLGGHVGLSRQLRRGRRVFGGVRVERIDSQLPAAGTPLAERVDENGVREPIDFHLLSGVSALVTAQLGFEIDRRDVPVLPHRGFRIFAGLDVGTGAVLGDYSYANGRVSLEAYRPLGSTGHALAVKLHGGIVGGDAPWHERLHLSEFDRLATPRAGRLTVSAAPAPALIGSQRLNGPFVHVGGAAMVEYIAQVFRSDGPIYGGDAFIGVGAWAAGSDTVVDAMLDLGVRFDTEIGIFELTLTNAVGRFSR